MARKCPSCFVSVSATKVLTYTNDLDCPSCHSPLEISALSRNLAAFAGLIVAAIFWRISSAYFSLHPEPLGWVLRVVFTCLAYSVAATLALAFIADLQLGFLDSPRNAAETTPAHHPSH